MFFRPYFVELFGHRQDCISKPTLGCALHCGRAMSLYPVIPSRQHSVIVGIDQGGQCLGEIGCLALLGSLCFRQRGFLLQPTDEDFVLLWLAPLKRTFKT